MKYSTPRSLSKKITLSMALRLMAVTVIIVAISYVHVASVVSRMIGENLSQYIQVRAERESEVFQMTEESHRLLRDRLSEQLAHPIDRAGLFQKLFVRDPDGAVRQRRHFDTTRTPSFFIPKGTHLDAHERGLALTAYEFLSRECLSSLASYSDCWVSFRDGTFGIFYPTAPDYTRHASANFRISDRPWFQVVDPGHDPERSSEWTNTYLDPNSKAWMVTLVTPIYVRGKFTAVLGNDLEVDALVKRTMHSGLEGTKNFVFRSDGVLISHPDYQQQIWNSGGTLNIRDLKSDGALREALAFTRRQGQSDSVISLHGEDALLAIAKLASPDWYIATLYPKRLIRAASMDACRLILLLGLFGLLIEIILLIRILDRKVEEPLESMIKVVRRLSRGDLDTKVEMKTNDELEILGAAFNDMTGKLKISYDQTKKAMDDALAASHAKSRFVANMSHEIRTPLHGIIGMAQFLDQSKLTEDQRKYVEIIRSSGKTLLSIVNQVLDISKIESNKFEIESVEFELEPLLKEVVSSLQYAAQMKNLPLILKLDFKLERRLRGDATRLKQVVFNLVNNAIKFSQTGEIVIRARTFNENAHDVAVRIEVEDHGMGIQESVLPRLFTPFAQADLSTARKFGGTGLGLYLCKSFVEAMGGSIGVKSQVNEGSLFWFEIPFVWGGDIELEPNPPEERKPVDAFKNAKPVLVAEDFPTNQFLMVKLLENLGLPCDVAQNGLEVLDALEKKQYSLILMDCQMPEMDGYEASMEIRSRVEAPYRYIPIIAVSANAMKGDREKCLAAGMNDLISKPVNAKEFQDKLKYWIGG